MPKIEEVSKPWIDVPGAGNSFSGVEHDPHRVQRPEVIDYLDNVFYQHGDHVIWFENGELRTRRVQPDDKIERKALEPFIRQIECGSGRHITIVACFGCDIEEVSTDEDQKVREVRGSERDKPSDGHLRRGVGHNRFGF